jgi:ribosomal protein L6P/L9E
MSRIAKNSIKIDKDILCSFQNGNFNAKGKLGEMNLSVDPLYTVDIQGDRNIC